MHTRTLRAWFLGLIIVLGVASLSGQTTSSMFLAEPDARIMLFTPTDWMMVVSSYISPDAVGGTVTLNLRKADGTTELRTIPIQSVICNPACTISIR